MKNKNRSAHSSLIKKSSVLYPNRLLTEGNSIEPMIKGKGPYLFDSKKRKYLDGNSGLWNVSLGYGHPAIVQAIIRQTLQLQFVNLLQFTHPNVIRLSEMLLELTDENFERVLLTCTGSESVEAAIKTARKFQKLSGFQKTGFATFELSYHGTTYGAMSASGIDQSLSKDYSPKVPGFIFLPTAFCSCCPTEHMTSTCKNRVLKNLRQFFKSHSARLAGVIVEPVIGSGGILPLEKTYLQELRKLCTENHVLLILDEVATGFGRTGSWFAFQQSMIVPDILCLGKGINSGYLPMGAVLISKKICVELAASSTFIEHFSTQNGNPIACASAIATIKILKRKNMAKQVQKSGMLLKALLKKSLGDHHNVFEIRGRGLMIAIDLVHNKEKRSAYPPYALSMLVNKLKKNGLLVYYYFTGETSGISLFPPFIINQKEIKKIVTTLTECLI